MSDGSFESYLRTSMCCDSVFTAFSLLQVTARLHSTEPVITVTLLHTTARSFPTTPSNMKTLLPSRALWVRVCV